MVLVVAPYLCGVTDFLRDSVMSQLLVHISPDRHSGTPIRESYPESAAVTAGTCLLLLVPFTEARRSE